MLFLLEEIIALRVGVEENISGKYHGFDGTRILQSVENKRGHSGHGRGEDHLVIYKS